VFVLFDDIPIYSKTCEAHVEHVGKSFQILQYNLLLLKHSKCSFDNFEEEYLGHIVSEDGV
jgi:hypothetical protein